MNGPPTPFRFVQTEFDERPGVLAGRPVAGVRSDESGRNEVYVRAFPKGEGKWVISTGGGAAPKRRGDGREPFYRVNRELWAVAIQTTIGLNVGTPHRRFDIGAGSVGGGTSRVTASGSWSGAGSSVERPGA